MKKIGIFGGTFNPIHNGHIKAAELAYNHANLDEVWFIPTKITPDKIFTIERISPKHKIKMIELAIKEKKFKWAKVNSIELKNNSISYSFQTIKKLKEKNPENKFYFIMGDDRYESVEKWKHYFEFRDQIESIIVLGRSSSNIELKNNKDQFIKDGILDISSSDTLSTLLWENIPNLTKIYIAKHKLYLKTLTFILLHKERYQHSVSVASHAKRLAKKQWFVNSKKAYISGLVHDLFKLIPIDEQIKILNDLKPEWKIPADPVVHGYSVAAWLEEIYKINDKKIISSIKKHTEASIKMSKLDKIIFVADKISSDRKGQKIGALRRLAYSNLDLTFVKILKSQIKKLEKKNIKPSKGSIEALKKYSGEKNDKIKKVYRDNKK